MEQRPGLSHDCLSLLQCTYDLPPGGTFLIENFTKTTLIQIYVNPFSSKIIITIILTSLLHKHKLRVKKEGKDVKIRNSSRRESLGPNSSSRISPHHRESELACLRQFPVMALIELLLMLMRRSNWFQSLTSPPPETSLVKVEEID